jgi:predicted DNA binding CopG/RHH family protein
VKTEKAEARWFEQNEERLLELFQNAAKKGTLRIGEKSVGITISKRTGEAMRTPTKKVMLRIAVDDPARAQRQAETIGIGYQTYVKMLLREGLDRAEGRGVGVTRGV